MKTANRKLSYEIKKLEYLLENKLAEIKAYKEEIAAQNQINSLCASFILYLLSQNGGEELNIEIPKSVISETVLKYRAHCSDGGEFYSVKLFKKDDDEHEKEV